ncbi:HEAT repeat domain-containing protein, partial [bacterium]|nr:HEAT repeat domain-containing protein [bacterium]
MLRKTGFMILLCSLLFVFCANFTPCWAAKGGASDIYFSAGVQKYLKGNLDGAIKDLEDAYNFDKNNKKVQAFLTKVLVGKGTEYYLKKDYTRALPYLRRAHELAPDNEKVKEMFTLVDAEVNPPPKPAPTVVTPSAPGAGVEVAKAPPAVYIPKTEGEKSELMVDLFATFQKQQEKILDAYMGPQEVLKDMIAQSDKERLNLYEGMRAERQKLFEMLEKKDEIVVGAFKESQNLMKKTMIYGIAGFVVAISVVIFFIYLILTYVSARREAILMQQQERILGMMQEQNVALASGQAKLMLGEPTTEGKDTITAREMMQDSNPHVRARGVEVIEAELVKEMDPEVAVKLLMPFLQDSDNRVKANAAKALYSFDKPRALDTLKEMTENSDKWMRVSAAWAFGEIGTEDAIDPLLELTTDSEYHVKRRAIKSLDQIYQAKKDSLSEEVQQKITQALEQERT